MDSKDTNVLAKIEIALERKIYKQSFYEFYKVAFCQLHPGLEYDENWHAKYLCDILQKETERVLRKERRDKDIIINVPPRSSKSLIASVIWPVWSWTLDPSLKFLTCSYSDTIATILSRYSRDLINTTWFQRLWGNRVQLRSDLSGASHYGTTATGIRYAFGFDGTVTGVGGDFVLCLRGDQKILTNKGEIDIKTIVEERLDVLVQTYSHTRKCFNFNKILRYDKNVGRPLLQLTSGYGNKIICTWDHLIYTWCRGYIKAINFDRSYLTDLTVINHNLYFSHDRENIIKLHEVPDYVYNIEVENDHNYFVNGILTHNCDDPQNPKKANSEVERENTIERYNGTISNRLNNLEVGGRVIIQQRLHERDLTGYLMDKREGRPEDHLHISIPAEYDEEVISPVELREKYVDGYFWKSKFSPFVLETEKKKGLLYYAGQFQQRPVPPEGNLFKKAWIEVVKPELLERSVTASPIHFFIDTAYTEDQTERNDPTGILAAYKKDGIVYIMNFSRVWMEFPKLIKYIEQYVVKHGYTNGSAIYIEPKASGKSVVQQLKASSPHLSVIEISGEYIKDDKVTRAIGVSPIVQGGRMKMIEGDWNETYLSELTSFPKAQHDEAVDTTVYALNYLVPVSEFFAGFI